MVIPFRFGRHRAAPGCRAPAPGQSCQTAAIGSSRSWSPMQLAPSLTPFLPCKPPTSAFLPSRAASAHQRPLLIPERPISSRNWSRVLISEGKIYPPLEFVPLAVDPQPVVSLVAGLRSDGMNVALRRGRHPPEQLAASRGRTLRDFRRDGVVVRDGIGFGDGKGDAATAQ